MDDQAKLKWYCNARSNDWKWVDESNHVGLPGVDDAFLLLLLLLFLHFKLTKSINAAASQTQSWKYQG